MGKYITPEHLASAQDNVVDKKNAEMEIKGITGVYGEAVYGAQGTDTTMPGYTTARGLTECRASSVGVVGFSRLHVVVAPNVVLEQRGKR